MAVAEGKLIPNSYLKIVQPAESGIVKEILVNEGQHVVAGQVLMRMDSVISDTDVKTLADESQRKALALRRIDAELEGKEFALEPGDNESFFQEEKASAEAPLSFRALVRLDAMQLKVDGETLPLSSGLQVSAEILIGKRTVLEYLLSPVRKAMHEAGREK